MADFFEKVKKDILEDEIKHDEKVIARKEADEKAHEAELKKDNTEFMQDIRDDEIKHDEKVIARKEADEKKHEAELNKEAK